MFLSSVMLNFNCLLHCDVVWWTDDRNGTSMHTVPQNNSEICHSSIDVLWCSSPAWYFSPDPGRGMPMSAFVLFIGLIFSRFEHLAWFWLHSLYVEGQWVNWMHDDNLCQTRTMLTLLDPQYSSQANISLVYHITQSWTYWTHKFVSQSTLWSRDKMAAISQTIFSDVFSVMKMNEFR